MINFITRSNRNEAPVIVFDFVCFTHRYSNLHEIICGGRNDNIMKDFENLLSKLKETGAKLVFFSDLSIQEDKIAEWTKRRDESFNVYSNLYDRITYGETLNSIISSLDDRMNLSSTTFGLSLVAQKFGEFYYTENECDLELIQYANSHKALAIVSGDSDFFIFEGNWKLWSDQGFDFDKYDPNIIKAIEYSRSGIQMSCSISAFQRPLFAALLGNGTTNIRNDELYAFQRTLGNTRYKFQNIAKYVRSKHGSDKKITYEQYKSIAKDVFRSNDENTVNLIKNGVDSYDLSSIKKTTPTDFEKKISKTLVYRDFVSITSKIQGFTSSFYDMRGQVGNRTLPELFIEWIKRKRGIFINKKAGDSEFIIITKPSLNKSFYASNERATFPDCKYHNLILKF